MECTHDPVIIKQDQDLQGEVDDNMDIIHSDPPEQVQEDPHDDRQDDQGDKLNNLPSSNGQYK